MEKALPRKEKKEAPKKVKAGGHSSKKTGSGGRDRYTYPSEKKGASSGKAPAVAAPVEPTTLPVSVDKLAARLGLRSETIHEIVDRFRGGKAPGGKDGFVGFMGAHLKELNEKHKIELGYYGRIYDASSQRK